MLSQTPIDLKNVKPGDLDKEILRASIIAEQDAINLYEQMANMTKSNAIKKLLLDVAKEEKTHVGEFHEMLKRIDTEYSIEIEKGKQEVSDIVGESKAQKLLKVLKWEYYVFW